MKIKLSYLERRRVAMLFISLLLAVVLWMFLTLNKNYVYSVKTAVKYENAPQNKAFHPLQSDTVELQIEGSGWHLLFAKMRIAPPSVSVNLRTLSTHNFVTLTSQLFEINKKLENSSQKIISIKPDTLLFDFSKKIIKYVPVKLVSDLRFKKRYLLSDSVRIFPGKIKVMGSAEELKKIDQWLTDTLFLRHISENTSKSVTLQVPENSSLIFEPQQVTVNLKVDEFTEKTLEVPIAIINNTNYRKVKLFPKKVKVTFLVSLKSYKDIDEEFVEASVDLMDWEKNKNKQLSVNLTRFPDFCRLVSISPQKVDFFIEK